MLSSIHVSYVVHATEKMRDKFELEPVGEKLCVCVIDQMIVGKLLDEKSLMCTRTLTHCLYMIWNPYHKEV